METLPPFTKYLQSAPAQPPTGGFVRDSDGDSVKKVKAMNENDKEDADGISSLVGSAGFAHAFIATLRFISMTLHDYTIRDRA